LARARLAIAIALAALALPAAAEATIVSTSAAHGIFTLQSNGVLGVLESIDVRADGPTPASWEVAMQRGELFAEPSLVVSGRRFRPGNGSTPGTFRISRGKHGVRFDWLQPAGSHSSRLGYRLALFGTAYTDVVDLRVPVWESWPAPVGRLTAALKLPRTPGRRVIVWLEPQSVHAAFSTTGNDVRLGMQNVDANQGITLHAVVPRAVLASTEGLNVEHKPGLATVLAERKGRRQSSWPLLVGGVLLIALTALVVLRTARWRRPPPR
jgi:Predicted membrane protein (DUF2207) N-terminal domain